MNILVTGCAGFIGSSLVDFLLLHDHKIIGIDNFDPFYPKEIKQKNLSNALKNPSFTFYQLNISNGLSVIAEKIDVVIHMAAKAGVRPSIENPLGYIETNIHGTQEVLNFMKERGIKKLVFASSSSVYGNNKKIPFSESDPVDNPISPYASTKKSAELLTYTYHHLYKIDVINLRFFTVYGPRQRPDLAIYKFVRKILNDEEIILFGDGKSARDYTFIDDILTGVYNAMNYSIDHTNIFETVNLGNNLPVKLNDLVSLLGEITGKKIISQNTGMQPGDVDITYADISRAQTLFHYKPAVTIKEGLKKFVEWYTVTVHDHPV
ncbi:MAG: GDP-mannose 4,6-dehydratase [Chitinophagaceae bacterium]|nr:GDP-mannose 4,6-dehydratase [Chitinophagaceae bacterium]